MFATSPRLRATVLRVTQSIPVVIGVVIISFLLTRALPGDPAVYFAGVAADTESIEQTRVAMGLDKPLIQQFFVYVGNLLQGDLGQSLTSGRSVATDLAKRLPASLELTLTALILAIVIAVPLGVLAATRPGTWVDHLCRVIVTAGVSLPTFFTGILLIYIFYYLLGIAPSPLGRLDFIYLDPDHVTGFYLIDAALMGDWETWRGAAKQLILPATTLALFTLAPIARMTRAAMLTALYRTLSARPVPLVYQTAQSCTATHSGTPYCRLLRPLAWCFPLRSERMCWLRKSSRGLVSGLMRSKPWWSLTTQLCRGSSLPWPCFLSRSIW